MSATHGARGSDPELGTLEDSDRAGQMGVRHRASGALDFPDRPVRGLHPMETGGQGCARARRHVRRIQRASSRRLGSSDRRWDAEGRIQGGDLSSRPGTGCFPRLKSPRYGRPAQRTYAARPFITVTSSLDGVAPEAPPFITRVISLRAPARRPPRWSGTAPGSPSSHIRASSRPSGSSRAICLASSRRRAARAAARSTSRCPRRSSPCQAARGRGSRAPGFNALRILAAASMSGMATNGRRMLIWSCTMPDARTARSPAAVRWRCRPRCARP